jgi:hypothetical protein
LIRFLAFVAALVTHAVVAQWNVILRFSSVGGAQRQSADAVAGITSMEQITRSAAVSVFIVSFLLSIRVRDANHCMLDFRSTNIDLGLTSIHLELPQLISRVDSPHESRICFLVVQPVKLIEQSEKCVDRCHVTPNIW